MCIRNSILSLFTVLAVLILAGQNNRAIAADPTFGWEFEFTNQELIDVNDPWGNTKMERRYLDQFIEMYRGLCPSCKFTHAPKHNTDNAFKVEFPDGFQMTIATKPSVFEFTGPPMTRAELEKMHPILEERIFKPAKKFKLFVNEFTAGHVSIGYHSGFETPEMVMKFYVDSQNYHYLWSHIFNNDSSNAPTLAQLGRKQRDAFYKLIRDFRVEKELQKDPLALRKRITFRVHTRTYSWNEAPDHYQAINIEALDDLEIKDQWRIELRGIRGQKKASDFALLSEIFERRLEFLRNSTTPLAYAPHEAPPHRGKKQFMVDSFYTYLHEIGLDFERYKVLLPKNMRNITPSLRPELKHENAPARLDCKHLFAS